MHYIGKEMKVVAEAPGGKTIPLIWIKDWDFNWQGQYQYRSAVTLPKGTVIKLDAYFDNSAENPRNPSTPPKQVGWGEQTTDEMCLLSVQVVADTTTDLMKILAMRGNGLGAILAGGDNPAAGRPGMRAAAKGAGGGFTIPEALKERLTRFDKDNDGKLSAAEIETVPEPGRARLKAAMGAGPAGKAATKAASKGAGGGFAIPEALKDRISRFDKDNDGKLSDAEVEAIPEPGRTRLKEAIRDRMAAGKGVEKP